jgi:preprotein translocase YajC subunit
MDDSLFLFLALAFLGAMLFYSSNKRKKAAKALQAQVVKGAYVMLTSGIYGKITAVLENRIELETAPGQKMLVATGAVRSVEEELKQPKPASTAAKPAAKSAPKAKSRPAVKGPAKTAAKKK